jgi:hypothetical protein
MPDPTLNLAIAGDSTKSAAPGVGSIAGAGHPHKQAYPAPSYFAEALNDAERLLKYAAESGIEVDDNTRDNVLEARGVLESECDEKTVANLLAALTKLSAQLKPVTAESLGNFSTRPTVRNYWIVSIFLVAFIVPISVFSFVSSAISQTIKADIDSTNELVRKLNAQIGFSANGIPADTVTAASAATGTQYSLVPGASPAEVLTQLQTLASAMRAIHDRAVQLNWFISIKWLKSSGVDDPHPSHPSLSNTSVQSKESSGRAFYELQVPVPMQPVQLGANAIDWIRRYQDVRSFGQEVIGQVSVLYGAISYCILPVLYALLGTCAYLLRSFSQQMSARTFVPSHSNSPRFLIAAIGGAVIGLFNNFSISQAPSISPLAIAFLVGYAVDVFFSFLEGLTTVFTKTNSGKLT